MDEEFYLDSIFEKSNYDRPEENVEILKSSEDDLFESVADAFADIERQEERVVRVEGSSHFVSEIALKKGNSIGGSQERKIWGAEIVKNDDIPSDHFIAFSEDGRYGVVMVLDS
jgi:hypothetical protein